MEEHERIRRSMMGWYAMFGANPVIAGCSNEQREYLSKPITYDEKEQKDCSSVSTEDRKDEAKALGARWDANKKQWYIFDDNKNKEELLSKYK